MARRRIKRRSGKRTYRRDARGRFATRAGGESRVSRHRRIRRRTALAGSAVAVVGVAATQARKGSHVRSTPTRRRLKRAHLRRVYRDHGRMALHRGTPFDQAAARKVASREYRGLAKHYRKQSRSDQKRARKRRR